MIALYNYIAETLRKVFLAEAHVFLRIEMVIGMYENLLLDKNNKETLVYGNQGFPIYVAENQLDRYVLGYIPWHWHEEVQLMVVTSGKILFGLQGEQHELAPGHGIFVNSGFLHMARPKEKGAAYVCIDATPKLFSSFSGSSIEEKYILPFFGSELLPAILLRRGKNWCEYVISGVMEIYQIYREKKFGYELRITAKLMEIWEKLINSDAVRKKQPMQQDSNKGTMKNIITFIESNFDKKIGLDDISKFVHLSKGECCRAFKRGADMTIFEYLIDYRIQKSAELLANSDMPISQIAMAVGFSSTSYFSEMFKKHTNQTPSEYRRLRE